VEPDSSALENKLKSESIDALTGLISRNGFLNLISAKLATDDKSAPPSGCAQEWRVIYLNLVNFTLFNIHYGSEAGDELLRGMAKLLQKQFPDADLARMGQDHFCVLTGEKNISGAINRIRKALPQLDPSRELRLKAGVRVFSPSDEISAQMLVDEAKLACDSIRQRDNLTIFTYRDGLLEELELDAYIVANVDRAIEEGDICVHYQPVVRSLTKKLCGFEALARWNDARYGRISPARFIPLLERTHSVNKVDTFVLRTVCHDLGKLLAQGCDCMPVSFNLSRVDFDDHDPIAVIDELMEAHQIPRNLIKIEITESAIMSSELAMKEAVSHLQKAGHEVWVDDLGSGYSSLSLLSDIPFNGCKIDASLMHNMGERAHSVVSGLVSTARKLGMHTLAEGAETEEQLAFLRSIGCEYIQSFYFGRADNLSEAIKSCCAHGIVPETAEEKHAFDATTSIDMTSTRPLALVADTAGSLSLLAANQSFSHAVSDLGKDDKSIVSELSKSMTALGRKSIQMRINDAALTGERAVFRLALDKHQLVIAGRLIADTGSFRLLTLEPQHALYDGGREVYSAHRLDSNANWGRVARWDDASLSSMLMHALRSDDPSEQLDAFLNDVGHAVGADRTYIVEISHGLIRRTHEWVADGVEHSKNPLEQIRIDQYQRFSQTFDAVRVLGIPDLSESDELDQDTRAKLQGRGAKSIILSPLEIAGKRLGYLGIENIADELFEPVSMSALTMSQFAAVMIRNRDILSNLQSLSMRDELTDTLNRRGLGAYVADLPAGLRLALIYCDINRLKDINDSLGHDAGDRVIKHTASVMLELASPERVFRLGGDEFAIAFELEPDDDPNEIFLFAQNAFLNRGVDIALGLAVETTPITSLADLLDAADHLMYKNKEIMHDEDGR
jgi:diguanylate cyclase (GGDEF)-like protein